MKDLEKKFIHAIEEERVIGSNSTALSSMHPRIINWIGENIDQCLMVVTKDGIINYATKSVYRKLNFKLIGRNVNTFVYQRDLSKIKEKLAASKKGKISHPLHVIKENNNTILLEVNIEHMKIEDQTFYICYLGDLTKEQQIEEMFIRAEKMSIAGQVAAGLAHEIRNPLTSLKGFIQLLQGGVEQKDTYYKILLKEIEKIETITTELLYIAKPLTYHKEKHSINQLVQEVIILLKPQARLKEVFLTFKEKRDYKLVCNGTHMKQILINLIKNAIEASSKSDEVIIDVYRDSKDLIIDVIDEGKGIPKEFIHKLEEPFFTTKEDGTGLGLMITKNLIEYHGAKLKVSSKENKGTIFRIILPYE